MKGRVVGVTTAVLVVVAGIGLAVTWDSTRTSRFDPVGEPMGVAGGETRADGGGDRSHGGTTDAAGRECTVGNRPAVNPLDDWRTVLVDPAHGLPPDFVPPDLVNVRAAGFRGTDDTVRRLVIADLTALRLAAERNRAPFVVVSGFRSYQHQQLLYARQVQEVGRAAADATTARPGHSEHQLGTTIDVLDPQAAELTTAFASTRAGRWLAANAHAYGFVLSYPDDTRERSCYEFEPWHLRYVGRQTAQRIRASGQTPREWMSSQPRPVR